MRGVCSALDLEEISKKDVYVGKRVNRGLFKSKDGIYLNADINGSLNIGRKVFGDNYVDNYLTNIGYGQYPVKVKL